MADPTLTQPFDGAESVSAKRIIERIGKRIGVRRLSAFLRENDPETRQFVVMVAAVEIDAVVSPPYLTEANIVQPERMHDVLRSGLTRLTGLKVPSPDVWHTLRSLTKKAAQEEVVAQKAAHCVNMQRSTTTWSPRSLQL